MTTARRIVHFAALGVILCWLAGCGPTAREKTIATTLAATDAARAAFITYDAKHQADLVGTAKDKASGEASLTEWRTKRFVIEESFAGAYRAIAAAATVEDEPTFAGMVQAALILAQELKALGVIP